MGDTVPFTPEGNGTIEYTKSVDELNSQKGIFSFTYYTRSEIEKIDPVYVAGLYVYMKLCEMLKYWMMVVYVDENTLQKMDQFVSQVVEYEAKLPTTKQELIIFNKASILQVWREIVSSPFVSFAIVRWPEYSPKNDMTYVDNSVMRLFRFRAFTEFPNIPVFVRDADTLFPKTVMTTEYIKNPENSSKQLIIKGNFVQKSIVNKNILPHLFEWEIKMLTKQQKSGFPFLVGSQVDYFRKWHKNRFTQMKSHGVYAGLVNSLGGIPEFQDGSLWLSMIDYIRRGTEMVNTNHGRVISNNGSIYDIGKDEQVLSFVFVKRLLDKTYFYLYDYQNKEMSRLYPGMKEVEKIIENKMNERSTRESTIRKIKNSLESEKKEEKPSIKTMKVIPKGLQFLPKKANNELERYKKMSKEELYTLLKEKEEEYEKYEKNVIDAYSLQSINYFLVDFVFAHPEFHEELKTIFQQVFSTMSNIEIYKNKQQKGENVKNLEEKILSNSILLKLTANNKASYVFDVNKEKLRTAIQTPDFYKQEYKNYSKPAYVNTNTNNNSTSSTQSAGTRKRRSKKQRTHKRKV